MYLSAHVNTSKTSKSSKDTIFFIFSSLKACVLGLIFRIPRFLLKMSNELPQEQKLDLVIMHDIDGRVKFIGTLRSCHMFLP